MSRSLYGAGVDVKLLDQVANLDWKDTPSPFSGSSFRQDYLPVFESMGTSAYWEKASTRCSGRDLVMETVMDVLALTDDEAVAIAATLPEPWRAPLPTVDQTNRDSLVKASYRGRRALVVRELAASDGTLTGLAAEVAKRLGTGLRAFFLLTGEDRHLAAQRGHRVPVRATT